MQPLKSHVISVDNKIWALSFRFQFISSSEGIYLFARCAIYRLKWAKRKAGITFRGIFNLKVYKNAFLSLNARRKKHFLVCENMAPGSAENSMFGIESPLTLSETRLLLPKIMQLYSFYFFSHAKADFLLCLLMNIISCFFAVCFSWFSLYSCTRSFFARCSNGAVNKLFSFFF